MSEQNIFDNEAFFEGYRRLRGNPDSANILEEKPALFSMLGNVRGKRVLDLGCGYGENCRAILEMGAKEVVGIDLSEKMLEIARAENNAPSIRYLCLAMEKAASLDGGFDVAVSSLAVHYVCDFPALARVVFSLLNKGGCFLFSQEHPLTTAPIAGAKWIRDENGNVDHYRLTDYAAGGERSVSWLVDGVVKYHRTFSELVNGLCAAGLCMEEMREPIPEKEITERLPVCAKDIHKPNFLLIRARKTQARS